MVPGLFSMFNVPKTPVPLLASPFQSTEARADPQRQPTATARLNRSCVFLICFMLLADDSRSDNSSPRLNRNGLFIPRFTRPMNRGKFEIQIRQGEFDAGLA